MFRPVFLLIMGAGLLTAAPMTYTLTGTGTGYWNATPFTNAAFTITFTSDTGTIVHGTSCCSAIDTTPSGTSASATVSGFQAAQLNGDQTIFYDRPDQTVGIWHFNGAQYLTASNSAFSSGDLTTTIQPTGGVTWSYATPISLSSGGTLYFTSVQNVSYSQQPGSTGGQVSTVSMSPNAVVQYMNTVQNYSFVVSDTAGANDIGGVDIQFRDNPALHRNTCWLYYNTSSNTMTANYQGNWSGPVPVGSSGSTLTGDDCTVDTTKVTAATSGNNLTLTVPVYLTYVDSTVWPVFVDAQNKDNGDAGYTQLGEVQVEPQTFVLSVTPQGTGGIAAGSSISYPVTVQGYNGFHDQVTFTATVTRGQKGQGGADSHLSITFEPATLNGTGTATMTVTAPASTPQDFYGITVTANSPSSSQETNVGLYVATGAPVITIDPTSGTGSSQTFNLTWSDSTEVEGIDLLFAPTVDGSHACWVFFDPGGVVHGKPHELYLAGDDGSTWADAGDAGYLPYLYGGAASSSNSQCSINLPNTIYDPDSHNVGHYTLTFPIAFLPAFAGTKSIWIESWNNAGFSSGYQAAGGWTVK
jgi:hypothetical protein